MKVEDVDFFINGIKLEGTTEVEKEYNGYHEDESWKPKFKVGQKVYVDDGFLKPFVGIVDGLNYTFKTYTVNGSWCGFLEKHIKECKED